MWYCQEKKDKFVIITIPLTTIFAFVGCLIIQIFVIWIFYDVFQNSVLNDFLGFGWLSKFLNLFLLFLPIISAMFLYSLFPIVKTEINHQKNFVKIIKFLPFVFPRKVGFDLIKDGLCVKSEVYSNIKNFHNIPNNGLFFQLNSGEILNLAVDNSSSLEHSLKIAEKANHYLKS